MTMRTRVNIVLLLRTMIVFGLHVHSEGGIHETLLSLGKKTHADPDLSEPVSGQRIRLGKYGNGLPDPVNDLGRGVVEVYRAGRWGIVCDDNWSLTDAHVACRELGFTRGARHALDTSDHSTGPWSDTSFVLDDVTCRGNESSLLECEYMSQHNCHVFEAVSVVCQPNQGCGESWVAGPSGCYLMQTQSHVRVSAAEERCSELGGYMVNVDNILENDFLSTMLHILYPEQTDWMTGGKYQSNKWIWKTLRRKKRNDKKTKSKKKLRKERRKERKRTNRKSIQNKIRERRDKNILMEKDMAITVWFPGWMPSHVNPEPSTTPGHDCVALSRHYTFPNGTVGDVGYFYWKAVECVRTDGQLSYICEKSLIPAGTHQECYTDDGEDYRGNVHITTDGLLCQNWTLSRTTNPHTSSDTGLGNHNFCRNPDEDVRPWCWTNVTLDEFAYCDIPQCHINNTSKSRTDVRECPKGQFHCHRGSEGKCIASLYRCDGEIDCGHSEDENGCEYMLPRFTRTKNVLSTVQVRKTYGAIPVELCAKFCLEERKFRCKSFSYRKSWKYCYMYLSSEDDISREANTDYDIYTLETKLSELS